MDAGGAYTECASPSGGIYHSQDAERVGKYMITTSSPSSASAKYGS